MSIGGGSLPCLLLWTCIALLMLTNAVQLPRPRIVATNAHLQSSSSSSRSSRSSSSNSSSTKEQRREEWTARLAKNSGTIGKIALSGGMAGGITVTSLLPIDTIKTMSQVDPSIRTVLDALRKLPSVWAAMTKSAASTASTEGCSSHRPKNCTKTKEKVHHSHFL